MRKPMFCICENKDAGQLRGNREADQRLCFRYIDSTNPSTFLIRNFKHLAIVGPGQKPECWFSHDVAHFDWRERKPEKMVK